MTTGGREFQVAGAVQLKDCLLMSVNLKARRETHFTQSASCFFTFRFTSAALNSALALYKWLHLYYFYYKCVKHFNLLLYHSAD